MRGDRWALRGDRWALPGDRWAKRGDRWALRGDQWALRGDALPLIVSALLGFFSEDRGEPAFLGESTENKEPFETATADGLSVTGKTGD